MTAPVYVATDWETASFNPGNGLPILTPAPQLISDQTQLNTLLTAAAKANLVLQLSATGGPATVAPPGYVPGPDVPLAAGEQYGRSSGGVTVGYNRMMAHAEYADNVAVALTPSTAFYLPGTAISVAASPDRDVDLEYFGGFTVTAAGAGQVGILLVETTSGTPTNLDSSVVGSTAFGIGTGSAGINVPFKKCPLGPTTVERQFVLAGIFFRDGGSVLAVSMKTGPSNLRNPWYLRAVA